MDTSTEKAPSGVTESVLPSNTGDQPSEVDELGFEPYVKALARFLVNPQTHGPLAVSIEGEWGSGKSSFMLQLEDELLKSAVQSDAKGNSRSPLTVRFNAWRHDKEDALWAAFALHFTRAVSAKQPCPRRLLGYLRLFGSRFNWREGWLDAARVLVFLLLILLVAVAVPIMAYERGWGQVASWAQLLLSAPQETTQQAPAIESPGGAGAARQPAPARKEADGTARDVFEWIVASGGAVGYLAVLLSLYVRFARYVTNPFEVDLKNYLESPNYADRISFIERFHEDFAKIVRALAGDRTVFVFIDDLDRCEVPKAADLMQALNLMISENPQLIFILGMDREKVAAGLAVKHEKLLPYLWALQSGPDEQSQGPNLSRAIEFGYEFIEKFVQVPFLVPKPTTVELSQMLADLSRPPVGARRVARLPFYPPRFWNSAPARSREAPRTTGAAPLKREAVEKGREWITLLATEDSQTIREIVLSVAPALGYNPRRLKQFTNLFRLRAFIAAETGLFDGSEGHEGALTLQQLGKFTALLLRWPLLVPELQKEPGLLTELQEKAIQPNSSVDPAVRRFLADDHLLALLREGCVEADGKPGRNRQWSLAHVDVRKLLQVSPRVRTLTSTPNESGREGGEEEQHTQAIGEPARRPRTDDSGAPTASTRTASVEESVRSQNQNPPSPIRQASEPSSTPDEAARTNGEEGQQAGSAGRPRTADSAATGTSTLDRSGVDESVESESQKPPLSARQAFQMMPRRFKKEAARGLNAVYQFDLSGGGGGKWHAIINNGTCHVEKGAYPSPSVTISMTAKDYLAMVTGKLRPQVAFMSGKLRVEGEMGLVVRMESLFAFGWGEAPK